MANKEIKKGMIRAVKELFLTLYPNYVVSDINFTVEKIKVEKR